MERDMESRTPTVIDLDAEAAKLRMFHGQTPQTTRAERKGSTTQLARYRDGLLLLGKSAGTGHWETHPEDELVYVLDGVATLDIVQKNGPQSFALGAGMIAIVPQSAWHRFHSADGRTTMSATIPGDHIDLDVDDPRTSTPGLDIPSTMRPPSIIDLDGTGTLEIVGEDGSQFFALRAGMIAVNPQGAWHRFHSSEGVTVMFATPNPSEHIELDVEDPR